MKNKLILSLLAFFVVFYACKEEENKAADNCLIDTMTILESGESAFYSYDDKNRIVSIATNTQKEITFLYSGDQITANVTGDWDLPFTQAVFELNAEGYVSTGAFNNDMVERYYYNVDGFLQKFEQISDAGTNDHTIDYNIVDGNIVCGRRVNLNSGEVSMITFEYYPDLNKNGLFNFISETDIQSTLPYGKATRNLLKASVRTFSDNQTDFRKYTYNLENGFPKEFQIEVKKKEDQESHFEYFSVQYLCQ